MFDGHKRLACDGTKGSESDDSGKDEEEDSADDEGGSDSKEPRLGDRLVNYGSADERDAVEGEGEDGVGDFGTGAEEMEWEVAFEMLLRVLYICGGERNGYVQMLFGGDGRSGGWWRERQSQGRMAWRLGNHRGHVLICGALFLE